MSPADPLARPAADEHAEYYGTYISKVPEGDVLDLLGGQLADTRATLSKLSPEHETFRYAPGKWSVREVVGHLIDTERVFAARAHWFARQADEPLPGMDQNLWAAASNACDRPLAELLDELEATRHANVLMLRGLSAEAWDRRGIASGVEFSVRALAFILAGHEIHHRRLLEERYVAAIEGGAGGEGG